MIAGSHYEMQGEVFAPTSNIHPRVFHTPEAVREYLEAVLGSDFHVCIAHIRGDSDLGDFLLWTRGDDAYVRVDEHQDHIAHDASRPQTGDEQVVFGDGFAAASDHLISRSKAIEALEYWLTTGRKSKGLLWT